MDLRSQDGETEVINYEALHGCCGMHSADVYLNGCLT